VQIVDAAIMANIAHNVAETFSLGVVGYQGMLACPNVSLRLAASTERLTSHDAETEGLGYVRLGGGLRRNACTG